MIRRFVAYRRTLHERGTHSPVQANPPDAPQFCGALFPDGAVTLRWLTGVHSTSNFASLADALAIHGHPEYGTDIVWLDDDPPAEWVMECHKWANKLAQSLPGGFVQYDVPQEGEAPTAIRVLSYSANVVYHILPWRPTEQLVADRCETPAEDKSDDPRNESEEPG